MVADYDYIGEWGFAALIESEGHQLLFDTGFRQNTVLENAIILGFVLSKFALFFFILMPFDHIVLLQTFPHL